MLKKPKMEERAICYFVTKKQCEIPYCYWILSLYR